MEVKYKGELFTKILIDNQTSSSSISSGQVVKLSCNTDRGQDCSIYIHKALLVANSALLRRLLLEDNSSCPTIIIPDFDIHTVEKFCRLLYQGYTLVNAVEIEDIRKLAEMLDFQKPTISDPSVQEVQCTTALKYSKSDDGHSNSERPAAPARDNAAIAPESTDCAKADEPILSKPHQTPETVYRRGRGRPAEGVLTSRAQSSHVGRPKKRSKIRQRVSSLSSDEDSDENVDDEYLPPFRRNFSPPSSPVPETQPTVVTRKRRRCSSSNNRGPELEVNLKKFIKCYFCSSTCDSEPSLITHLTESCGKHLIGHFSFKRRYCHFCKSTSHSLTQWGYVKHLDSCFKKSGAQKAPQASTSTSRSEVKETDSGTSVSNSNSGTPRRIFPVRISNCSAVSDSSEVVGQKQLRIMGALMTVKQFRTIRKQYRVSAANAVSDKNTQPAPTVQISDRASPFAWHDLAGRSSISSPSGLVSPVSASAAKGFKGPKLTENLKIDMSIFASNPTDDGVPIISNVHSVNGSMVEAPHSRVLAVEKARNVSTLTLNKLTQGSLSAHSNPVPIVQDALTRNVPKSPQTNHFGQNDWDSMLIEAVNRICSQNQRSDAGKIYHVVRLLASNKILASTNTVQIQMQDVQTQLDFAVRRGLLLEIVKEGQILCYLTNPQKSSNPMNNSIVITPRKAQQFFHPHATASPQNQVWHPSGPPQIPLWNPNGSPIYRSQADPRFQVNPSMSPRNARHQYQHQHYQGVRALPPPSPPFHFLRPPPPGRNFESEYSRGIGAGLGLGQQQGNLAGESRRFNGNGSTVCVDCGMTYENPQLLMTHICGI